MGFGRARIGLWGFGGRDMMIGRLRGEGGIRGDDVDAFSSRVMDDAVRKRYHLNRRRKPSLTLWQHRLISDSVTLMRKDGFEGFEEVQRLLRVRKRFVYRLRHWTLQSFLGICSDIAY